MEPDMNPPCVPRLEQECFLVYCRDGADTASLRKEHLDGHLRHVEKHWQRYITAGPVREPGGDALVGSVFLVLADSLEEAKALMSQDPYIACGMYESIEYKSFSNSIGQYMGGKIWDDVESIRHRAAGGPQHDVSKGISD